MTVSGASARSVPSARGRGHGGAEDPVSGSSARRPRPCRCGRGAVRLRAIGAALPRTLRSEARGPGRGAALAARRIFLSPFSFRRFKEGSSCAFYRFFFTSALLSLLLPLIPSLSFRPRAALPRSARRSRRPRALLPAHCEAGTGAAAAPPLQRPAGGGRGQARERKASPGGAGASLGEWAGGCGGVAAPPPGAPCERGARRWGGGGVPRPVGGCGAGPTGGAAADLAPALPRAAALCPPLGLTRSPGSILARAAVCCLPASAPALRCPRPRAAPRARRGPDLLTAAPGKVAAFSDRRNNCLHCAKRAPCLFCFLNVRPRLRLFWLNFLVQFTRGVGFFFFVMCEACSLCPTPMLLLSGLYLFRFLLRPNCVELKSSPLTKI